MELKITTFYCLCDDPQCAKVMTAALTAAAFFSGSYERSCKFLEQHGYMPAMAFKKPVHPPPAQDS